MNIHELSTRTGISLSKLRTLHKLKVLTIEPTSEFVDMLRFHMGRDQQMTVAHMVAVLDEPALLDELGAISKRFEDRARAQMEALGVVSDTAAPKHVTGAIVDAARGDKDAATILADWIKGVLPAGEAVSHHWVAVRLLYPLNEFLRDANAPKLSLVLLAVRQLPEFAAWWRTDKIGARNTIKYVRPALDIMDL